MFLENTDIKLFFKDLFYYVYNVLCLHVCLKVRREHHISFQMVVSHHVVAGIELRTSRTVSALNC